MAVLVVFEIRFSFAFVNALKVSAADSKTKKMVVNMVTKAPITRSVAEEAITRTGSRIQKVATSVSPVLTHLKLIL
jgi:hypothetical protein